MSQENNTIKLKSLYSKFSYPGENNHNNFFIKGVYPYLKTYKINSILEAGCGTGTVLLDIYKCFSNSIIVGIDFTETSLKEAKNKFEVSWVPQLGRGTLRHPMGVGTQNMYQKFPPYVVAFGHH